MLSTISTQKKIVEAQDYITSDGRHYINKFDANTHECFIKIESIFSDVAIRDGMKSKNTMFYLSRHLALECGVYRLMVKDEDEMEALDFFFIGLYDKLGCPETYPVDVSIEIYPASVDDVVHEHALWRIYESKPKKS